MPGCETNYQTIRVEWKKLRLQSLRTFFIKVRRHDDNPYEPDSIKAMQNSIDRYLSEKDYDASLLRDHVFKGSRLVMDAKRKNLKHDSVGRKPRMKKK